jgi:fructokinase
MPSMIVVSGEALIDRLVGPDGAVNEVPGGGPFNTARTLARLGARVAFLGCLSTDRHGLALRSLLEADGVDTSLVTTADAPTTVAIAHLDLRGAATYRFETAGTSAPGLDSAAVAAALDPRPDALHVGTLGLVLEPIGSALADAVAAAEAATLVMVDPNVRPAAITDPDRYTTRLFRILHRADVVKASREDLAWLWPDASLADASQRLVEAGARVTIVTDGARSVHCRSAAFAFELPVPAVDAVDTVGAGDAFGGGFLARWTELGLGRDGLGDQVALRDAIGLAIEVASRTCTRPGADPPRRSELAVRLRRSAVP